MDKLIFKYERIAVPNYALSIDLYPSTGLTEKKW